MTRPLVSIVVPAHNEEDWIAPCLAAIAAQDYAHGLIELIVVVDGNSTDNTEEVCRSLLAVNDYKQAFVLRNPANGTPSNLNLGLSAASGEILCRVDARSVIPPDYVSRCVDVLGARADVSVVGGRPIAIPGSSSPQAIGVARAFNNRYAMGWSRHHRSARSGPSDTVYLGAFRTGELRTAGGWNVAFPTNQDFELNRRLAKVGVVWFDSRLEVRYVTRASVQAFLGHYVKFGRWKVRYWRATGDRPRPRQMGLLIVPPLALIATVTGLVAGSSRQRAALLSCVALGAAVVEVAGSRSPRGGARVHAWSLVALGAASIGWLGGVWAEFSRGWR